MERSKLNQQATGRDHMEPKDDKIKYVMYVRKSSESEDRQIASMDSQKNDLNKIVERDNLEIVEIFEEAKSAKNPNRPIFNKMIEKIKSGKANGVICWKMDRLSRNPVDAGTIIWLLQEGVIKHIKAYDRDFRSADHLIPVYVELGMAILGTIQKSRISSSFDKGI
jgi:predicted site-specific integrase-resolvase